MPNLASLQGPSEMSAEMAVTTPDGRGGGGRGPKKEDRIPQWGFHETKEFIAIRAELEKDFTQTKRNKTLWELISGKMKEKSYRRSADQCKCKWKNLVNRYKVSYSTLSCLLCRRLLVVHMNWRFQNVERMTCDVSYVMGCRVRRPLNLTMGGSVLSLTNCTRFLLSERRTWIGSIWNLSLGSGRRRRPSGVS
jgi:hypothetical protein